MTTIEIDRAAEAATLPGVPCGPSPLQGGGSGGGVAVLDPATGRLLPVKHLAFDRTGEARKPFPNYLLSDPQRRQRRCGNQVTIMLRVGRRLPTRLAVAAGVA